MLSYPIHNHSLSIATSTMTMLAPNRTPPPTRNPSPFKDPRPPPGTPAKTAMLWDKYERQAIETARMRERATQPSQPPRLVIHSNGEAHKSEDMSPTRPSFDFKFRRSHAATPSATMSTCKTCTLPITYASGICEGCTRTIVMPCSSGQATPPLSPAARNFASTDLRNLHKNSSMDDVTIRTSIPSRRTSFCPLPAHLADPSFRLSSLPPPPDFEAFSEPMRGRKISLTDPNEPFLRLQISRQTHVPRSQMNSPPMTPTSPPWATQSRCSTRRSSLANAASLPAPTYPHARTDSVALSEYSTLCPYQSTVTTSLENTISAWDDWDSDSDSDDADRLGLSSWIGRRKTKSRAAGAREGKGSMDSTESDNEATRPSPSLRDATRRGRKSSSKEDPCSERARIEAAEMARTRRREMERQLARKKPSGFIRVITCGRGDVDDDDG